MSTTRCGCSFLFSVLLCDANKLLTQCRRLRRCHCHCDTIAYASAARAVPRLPVLATCHCNDCRSATASIVPAWMLTPRAYCTISCLPRQRQEEEGPLIFEGDADMPRLKLSDGDGDGDGDGPGGTTGTSRPPYEPAFELLADAQPHHGTSAPWLSV